MADRSGADVGDFDEFAPRRSHRFDGRGDEAPPSGVDAVVAAAADARAAHDDVLIVTSDGGDVQMLGPLATNAARLSVLVV